MFYNDIKQKMLLWMHENTWKHMNCLVGETRVLPISMRFVPLVSQSLQRSLHHLMPSAPLASLLNRSAFQLRFHTFTDSPWLDSVVPFVPLNHEIISHKFKLCCLITTSVRSWEVNAQELLHHAGQKPSQNCAVQLVEKVFIHSFQLIELALFQMTMASSKSERWNNPKTCSSTRCCKTISFWMALPSLASIYLHTWAGACAQARFNFW